MIKLTKSHWIGIATGVLIILISLLLFFLKQLDSKILFFIIGLAVVIAGLPFLFGLFIESQAEKNKEQMFLEFARDLVEGVKSGTPISKSIINVKNKDYGTLNPYINKLANQIALGIPVKEALEVFSKEVNDSVISRSISLIKEAEKSGGKIENILESVASSVSQIEKLRKERKAAIYTLAVQGYIIFLVFILIMLIMQFKILPITTQLDMGSSDMSDLNLGTLGGNMGGKIDIEGISNSFLYLLLSQGFFAGLVIGKISEGTVKSGLKHSFILVAISWLVSAGARAFLG